jgi:hypothetical protein
MIKTTECTVAGYFPLDVEFCPWMDGHYNSISTAVFGTEADGASLEDTVKDFLQDHSR